jgi:hypothetical protein
MAIIPYDSANGQDIQDGTKDLNPVDGQFDPVSPDPLVFAGFDYADIRDWIQYARGLIASAVIEPVESLQFDPQATPPSEVEGKLYFDDVKQNLVLYNDATGTALDVGRELRSPRAVNNTGSAITNGQIVYISGASGSSPEVSLAIADSFDTSRVIAMCTEASIADGSSGEFTTFGCVGGLDTSSYSPGDKVYLSESTAGAFTGTAPTGEYFRCEIGTITVADSSDGKLFFSPFTPELAVEVTRNRGWPANNADECTLSFVDGTRTFTITPDVDEYHFYQEAMQYRKTSAESIVISDVSGSHFIYYDSGTLTEAVNPSITQIDELILNKVFVSYIYWNATAGSATIVAEERHKAQTMDGLTPKDHAYTHLHEGSRYVSGYTPDTVGTGGGGSSNADAQFGIGAGATDDEDIRNTSDAVASTTGLRYYYRSGTNGDWTYGTNSGYSFPVGATPLPQYNEDTGATWQLTEVPSGDYMLLHVFGINTIDTSINAACVLGQEAYSSLSAAQTAAESDIYNFNRGTALPFQEFVPCHTFILECKTTFSNTPQARLVVTADGGDYVDFRSVTSTGISGGGGGSTSPGGNDTYVQYNNAGTFGGSSGMTYNDSTNTLAVDNLSMGSQSTNDILISTDAASTSDTALVTAGYVDANAGGGSSNTEQLIAYAASITPDLSSGNVVKIGTLTGNITVNNPTNATTAEEVYIRFTQDATGSRTVTLGSDYVLLDSNSNYPDGPNEVFFFSGITQSDGTIEGGFSPVESVGIGTASYSANQTLTASQCYGDVIYVTGAATITLPAVASGMSVSVITIGSVAVSIDPNASDKIWLDGTALDDGDKITNLSTAGDIATLTYYSADGWHASSNSWTDGGA